MVTDNDFTDDELEGLARAWFRLLAAETDQQMTVAEVDEQ